MTRVISIATAILCLGSGAGFAADKPEDLAKAAVEQFMKAVKAKDVDAVMKVAGVPWWAGGKDVVDSPELLKTNLKFKLEALKKPETIPSEVLRVERWDKFPRREKLGAEVMKKVDDVVGKDGLVATLGREGKEVGAILVRVEAGKAKVVGVED